MNKFLGKFSTLVLIPLLCLTCTTGCWDMREPNKLGIVIGSGVDAKNGKISLSSELISPKKLGGSEDGKGGTPKGTIVYTATGRNIYDAIRHMQAQVSRQTSFGHRQAILLGERIARQETKNLCDSFGRSPESDIRAFLIVIRGETAEQFIRSDEKLEVSATTAAVRAIRLSGMKDPSIRRFEIDSYDEGITPIAAAISATTQQATSGADESGSSKQSTYLADSLALFNHDAKLVGFLDGDRAKQALWAAGRLSIYTMTINSRTAHGTLTIRWNGTRRHAVSTVSGKRIRMVVTLTGSGTVLENNTNLDLSNAQARQRFESEVRNQLSESASGVIRSVQRSYRADMFGFGDDVKRRHPQQWKQIHSHWDSIFPDLPVTVIAKVTIHRIGSTTSRPVRM